MCHFASSVESTPGLGEVDAGDRWERSGLRCNWCSVGASVCLPTPLGGSTGIEVSVWWGDIHKLELAGPVERMHSTIINGIHAMPVRFTPTRRARPVITPDFAHSRAVGVAAGG
jgi:hypothetical protein